MNAAAHRQAIACHRAFGRFSTGRPSFLTEFRAPRPRAPFSLARSIQRHVSAVSAVSSIQSEATSGYRLPPQEIVKIVETPPEPSYSFSPSRTIVLELRRPPSNPPIVELARPELKLAGVRIDPEGYCRSRMSYYTGMALAAFNDKHTTLPFSDGQGRAIAGIPKDHGINDVAWSPNGEHIAFTVRRAGSDWEAARPAAQLWVADVASGQARCLLDRSLNSIFEEYSWVDDDQIIANVIPAGHPPPPLKPAAPLGPRIEDNEDGKKSQTRTYQDLLKNSHDVELYEHYCTTELVSIKVSTGETTPFSQEPRVFTAISPSPGGTHVLVAWLEPPWSYAVPCGRFPKRVQLWDSSGAFVREIAALPLATDIPLAFDSCRAGPRAIQWRDDKPAELVWVEAQDGGDPAVQVSPRDVVYALDAASAAESVPRRIGATDMRYSGITWGTDEVAIMYEGEWKSRRSQSWIFSPGAPEAPPQILFDRNYEDAYSDPGSPMMRRTSLGQYVLALVEGSRKILLQGSGASPEGSKPFLDVMDLDTRETSRLWQSAPPHYEFISSILDDADDCQINLEGLKLLARRESVEDPPQYHIITFAGGEKFSERQISSFPHPYPSLQGLTKQVLKYTRSDGVELNGTLYLPPGYDKETSGPLPCILWAYPREFKSKDAAGQVRKSPYAFDGIGSTSPLLLLTQGFAVLDGPSMPIIGEDENEPNDTYVEQLTSSAAAAVEELRRQGTVDVDRLAVAGHSYGAFMAAGLLAHAPELFKCGIARSGAFNRTLTPFGFQSEERTLWQAPETYAKMSPFMNADKIKTPLLLIHGEADNNPGTLPMQSERLFSAVKGGGTVCRLVLLPFESHSYAAKESILHTMAETCDWLQKYC